MKRFSAIIIVTILILLIPVISQASCNIIIDGESLLCYDANGTLVEPFVHEGTTYVPVRAIATAFDTTVSWDQATKTVHLGEVGGTPEENDEINIYHNGEEFICSDVNGNRVYPILREGTTFLPIRSIGTLFGKKIHWDNLTQTATLTTAVQDNVAEYLTDSVNNTAALPDTTVDLTVKGTAEVNGVLFSEKENTASVKYSPTGFTLSAILPDSYSENISYLGSGKYFIVAPSTKFISDQLLQEALTNQQTPTEYSSLYIYLSTKGGYITDITLEFFGKASYGGITLDQKFTITALLNYPEGFEFPITPYPDKPLGENEKPVSATTGEQADSTMINALVKTYVSYLTDAQAKKLFALVNLTDYDSAFAHKSAAQLNMEFNNISKALAAKFEYADGTFTLDSLVYIDPEDLTYPAEDAAKAEIGINFIENDEAHTDAFEVIFVKKDGKWYLDISSAMELYEY